jgi:hypothetical protein
MTPATTPAAMPALLGPPDDCESEFELPVAVTTIVWPASVMTEGAAVLVPEEEEPPLELAPDPEEPPKLSTRAARPSSDTDQVFCPPPAYVLEHEGDMGRGSLHIALSNPSQGESHSESSTKESAEGS